MGRLFPAVVLGVGVACSSAPARRAPPPPLDNHAAPAPAVATATCYHGDEASRGGSLTGLVLRRTLDPPHATITEDWSRTAGTSVNSNTLVWTITGDRFVAKEHSDRVGTGVLHGASWHWTGWTLAVPLRDQPGGPMLTITTEVTAAGLHATVTMPDGTQPAVQELDSFDCKDYELERRRLWPIKEPMGP